MNEDTNITMGTPLSRHSSDAQKAVKIYRARERRKTLQPTRSSGVGSGIGSGQEVGEDSSLRAPWMGFG